ncbi:hypothetical protein EDD33_3493 [Nocardioides aurantiacus]|uniref:DUF2510 domain-containing protein n=1 Tax=Nocardioides aurantiacus TaxID=86796 RepID=A0A3N2CYI1_9ACTN|nr:hypothetical protein EDD33_3493 [Nocardioides aurantiacus]
MRPHTHDTPDGTTAEELAVGWYRHPSRPLDHRFWDGRAWTDWDGRAADPPVPPQREDRPPPAQTS